jgi:polyisoprenoid-binding protein YceI
MFVHIILKTTMKNLKNLFYVIFAMALLVACDKKENKSEGTEQTATGVDTAAYKIDTAASNVKWLGKKVTGQHNGTIKIQDGELTAAGSNLIGGNIVINMASIKNEDLTDPEFNGKLIGHLKSPDFFSTDSFPTSTFVIKNVKDGTDGKKNVTGDLTIKGITNEITFPADIKADSTTLKGTGKAVLDRTKWNIKYGSANFIKGIGDKAINDEFELEFNITAVKK